MTPFNNTSTIIKKENKVNQKPSKNYLWTNNENYFNDRFIKRNKSAERRPLKKNLEGEQYVKILCFECGEKNYFGNYCNVCKGPICSKCKVSHLIENPNHEYNIDKNINFLLKEEKCTKCEKILENKFPLKCLNCPDELFCNECSINHNLIYPEHIIISNMIGEKDNNIDISETIKCSLCQNKIIFRDNYFITHCNKCKGNLCPICENTHSKKYPLHKPISMKSEIITDISNFNNYFQCIKCSQNLNNTPFIYNCSQCNGNLCENCGNDHHKEEPKHKISILRTKLPKSAKEDITCFHCGRSCSNFCDRCKISLCKECKENHKLKYLHHKIIIIKNEKLNNQNEESKDKDSTLLNDKSQNCVLCGKRMKIIDINNNFDLNFCDNCEGIMCKNCIIRHRDYYPNHKMKNYQKKIKEKNSLKNNKEYEIKIKLCYQCKRNLNNNNSIQYCFRCNEFFCDKCGKSHNFKFPKHKLKVENNNIKKEKSRIVHKENYKEKEKENEEINIIISKEEPKIGIKSKTNDNFENNLNNSELISISSKNAEKDSYSNFNKLKNLDNNKQSNLNKCDDCGKNKNIIKACEKCDINLCENCLELHLNDYPSHNPLFKKKDTKIKNNEFNEKELNIKRIRCIKCKKNMNIKNNDNIIFCGKCKGNICEKCKKNHIVKYPKHTQITSTVAFYENSNQELKCISCKKDLSNKINEPISTCFKCKGCLCSDCSRSHNTEFIRHRLEYKSYIHLENEMKENDSNIKNLKKNNNNNCRICQTNIIFDEKEKNNYCFNCEGIICENCVKIHFKKNDNHKITPIKIQSINDNIKQSNQSNINCIICCSDINNMKDSLIFNCSQCYGILCNDCQKDHFINKPRHELSVIKYILKDKTIHPSNCAQCRRYINNLDNYKNCEDCKIQFCLKCGENHKKRHQYHYITTIKKDENENELNGHNLLNSNQIYCSDCQEKISIKNMDYINYCENCESNLCLNCVNKHSYKYENKKHKITYHKLNNINTKENNLLDSNKSKENHEFLDKDETYYIRFYSCGNCRKKIKLLNNQDINICIDCDKYLCENCIEEHSLSNAEHDIEKININIILANNKNIKLPELLCLSCKKYLNENISDNIYYCQECNDIFCNNCINKHINKNLNHNLKYKKYIVIDKSNIEDYNCFLCQDEISSKNEIKYCYKCKEFLCNICYEKHKKNLNHNSIISIYKIDNINKNNIEQCYSCNKNLVLNDYSAINHCFNCNGNLCIKCSKNHIRNNKSHDLNLLEVKLLKYKDNINESYSICDICGNTIKLNKSFYKCENCESDLCEKCLEIHYKSKPNHNFTLVKYVKNEGESDNNDNININDYIKCNNCSKLTSKEETIFCENCRFNLCKKCVNNFHKKKYPYHYLVLNYKDNTSKIIKHSSQKNILSKKNLSINEDDIETCDKCLKESKKSSIYKCYQCKIKLCKECSIQHNKMFNLHSISLLTEEKEEKTNIKCDCLICHKAHWKNPNRFYYKCSDCESSICSLCKKNHDSKFYYHILSFPHKYGEENDINKKHRRYSSVG